MSRNHRLGWMLVMLAAALPASAGAPRPATVSGSVTNTAGVPQMGAVVEIFASATEVPRKVFTDERGHFLASGLAPGRYYVKVSAPSFLPTLRENLVLRSGTHAILNLTLNTLFEALLLLSPEARPREDEDDWKWTLRSTVNRPVLRLSEGESLMVVSRSGNEKDRVLKARLALVAGGDPGPGSSDMNASFLVERSLFSAGTLSVGGNLGQGPGTPGVLRASYSHRLPDGSRPEVALTMRRFATAETVEHGAALEALALSLSDTVTVGSFLQVHAGGELQSVQFGSRVSAVKPFGSAELHLTPYTVLSYRYATSQPNTRMAKGFDTAPADLSESGPRFTLHGGAPLLEQARHQEIALSRRIGGNNLQVAAFADRLVNTALLGVGDADVDGDDVLTDVYSNTFAYNGGNLSADGVRVVFERQVMPEVTATFGYAFGGVLDLLEPGVSLDEARASLRTVRRHAASAKLSGRLPGAKTRWIASYKWTSGRALTPVDMFDASPGQTDPYLSLFIRQPIPVRGPGQIEALVDVRNLLAQGYVPVVGSDGQTLYLVQAARSVRGGLAFTF
ncbi:MAG TPA: carboxypeptidase-like regulatory domain-containing protein [Terriglobales bacterium]|nr:carboxypeptidase-like regulatory domain-containing protein [Terriglobales bacterium]